MHLSLIWKGKGQRVAMETTIGGTDHTSHLKRRMQQRAGEDAPWPHAPTAFEILARTSPLFVLLCCLSTSHDILLYGSLPDQLSGLPAVTLGISHPYSSIVCTVRNCKSHQILHPLRWPAEPSADHFSSIVSLTGGLAPGMQVRIQLTHSPSCLGAFAHRIP